MIRRVISGMLFLAFVLCLFPHVDIKGSVKAETNYISSEISIGDTITMGTYNGEPIVWRCVDLDENGPLMLSETVLCSKEFDAPGVDDMYHTDGWERVRKNSGSNCWSDSNIRQWLNTSGVVEYTHCPPSYSSEMGFKTFFSASELAMVKTVTQRAYVNSWEAEREGYIDGGNKETDDVDDVTLLSGNYIECYYQNVADDFFLLNQEQIYRVYNNNPSYILSEVECFTRVAGNSGASYENVFIMGDGTVFRPVKACYTYGIRPAFYLDVGVYQENRPTLSEESAIMFVGFITNKARLDETAIKNSLIYQVITNTYSGNDFDQTAEGVIAYIIAASEEMADKATNNREFLNSELTLFFERELNRQTELPEAVINEYQNAAAKKVTEVIAGILDSFFTNSADNPFDSVATYNAICSISGSIEKGKILADRIIGGIETTFYVLEAEKSGRYTYFSNYLSLRGNYESKEDKTFRLLMNHNRLAVSDQNWMANLLDIFSWITNKDAFTNHFALLDEWGEYVHQLRCYCQAHKQEIRYVSIEDKAEYAQTTTGVEIIYCPQETGTLVSIPAQINGSNVVSIGNNAFENCNEIVEISIGETVQSIGANAFYGCEELSTVILGANVQTISDRAFENCTKLETVVVSGPISEMGSEVFLNCSDDLNIVCECNNATVVSYCIENHIEYTLVHIFEGYISNQDATCSEYGTSTATCLNCMETDTQTDYGSMEEHCWVYGKIQESQDDHVLLQEKTCSICEAVEYIEFSKLKFTSASLTLYESLTVNFKVDAALFETYSDPYVMFELNGVATTVTEYTVDGDYYVFVFDGILPNQMNDEISATLCATLDGTVCMSEELSYSVATYCYNMLEKYAEDEKLRTLLVDILNYGAATQAYTGYNTENLANTTLTSEQQAWASPDRALASVENKTQTAIENPSVTWIGAGLNLSESIAVRYEFTAESVDGLTAKVSCGDKAWEIGSFAKNANGQYVFPVALNASYMSESIYVTLYNGDTAVSDTVCYSIESYASTYEEDAELGALVQAMMKYGDAAKAYISALD